MAIYNPVQISISSQPGQVWAGINGSPTVLLVNTDANSTVYVGYQSNVSPKMPNTVPVGPFASVTMDGSRTIYAVGANVTAPLTVIPGGSSYSPGSLNVQGNLNATVTGNVNVANTPDVNVANSPSVSIASGTVDINTPSPINVSAATVMVANVNDDQLMTSISGTTIVPGTPNVSPLLAMTQPSFLISGGFEIGSTATNPFVEIFIHWVDSTLAWAGSDTWIFPVADNGILVLSARDRSKVRSVIS